MAISIHFVAPKTTIIQSEPTELFLALSDDTGLACLIKECHEMDFFFGMNLTNTLIVTDVPQPHPRNFKVDPVTITLAQW